MNHSIFLAISLALTTLLSGCSSVFIPVKPDAKTGHFQPSTKLPKDNIKVFTPIHNLNKQKFNVVIASTNTSLVSSDKYGPYVIEMLENCGLNNFVSKRDLENLVIASNLGEKIPGLDNRIAFNQLSKYIGQYLIIFVDLTHSPEMWQFSITVYDPVSSSTKFHVSHKASNHAILRNTLLLPVFNSLKDWVDKSKSLEEKPNIKGIGV